MDVVVTDTHELAPIGDLDGWDRLPAFAKTYLIEHADRPVTTGGRPDYEAYWKARLCTVFREGYVTEGMRCMPVLAFAASNARRFGSVLQRARWSQARAGAQHYIIHNEFGLQQRHFITKVNGTTVAPEREVWVFFVGDRYYGVEKVGNFLAPPTSP